MVQRGKFFLRDKEYPYLADEYGLEIQLHDDGATEDTIYITWYHLDRLRKLVEGDEVEV